MSALNIEAISANNAGVELADAGRYGEAAPLYERALALQPDWYAPHLNLGIACKHIGDWQRSLAASLRAYELDSAKAGDGALWNAGIAATAVGDWARARWAWSTLGMELPAGEGPIDMDIGITPIRVSVNEHPEVVWCHRIDPARALIENIPTPETGRRFRDLLLHDGEPRGQRRYREHMLSVFEELAVLETSAYQTWQVELVAPSSDDIRELVHRVVEHSTAWLEDWTASLEILCKQCSEGTPHEHHDRPEPPWKPERAVAVATRDDAVFALIREWAQARPGRGTATPELLLP